MRTKIALARDGHAHEEHKCTRSLVWFAIPESGR